MKEKHRHLITATVVERALDGARQDRTYLRKHEQQQLANRMQHINHKLKQMDHNGDGQIDLPEIQRAWTPPSPLHDRHRLTLKEIRHYDDRVALHHELKEALGSLDEIVAIFKL